MNTKPNLHSQSGVALLESLIAILIFAFGVLGLMGLFASTMKATTQAKTRSDASLLVNERLAEMWVNRAALGTYVETDTDISAALPGGLRTTAVNGTEVTITVTWRMPGEATDNRFISKAQVVANN